jgi:hypothetical protein
MKPYYLPLLYFVVGILSIAMVRTVIDVIRHNDWSRLKFTGQVLLGFVGLATLVGLAFLSGILLDKIGNPETLLSSIGVVIIMISYAVAYCLSIATAIGVIGCFFMTAIADHYELRS